MTGVEGAALLKQRHPNLLILMNTVYDDDERVFDAVVRLVRAVAPAHPQTRFLLLTQQPGLVQRLAQALIGFVRSIELAPIQPDEAFANSGPEHRAAGPLDTAEMTSVLTTRWSQDVHWLRGGLPESLHAVDDEASFRWRADYTNALLNGDFRDWGIEAGDRLRQHGHEEGQEDGIGEDHTRPRRRRSRAGILRLAAAVYRDPG